jgi:hypothetical protein
MGPLGPLLTYILFHLPNSAEQRSQLSPFHPVESGGEVSQRSNKSTVGGVKTGDMEPGIGRLSR